MKKLISLIFLSFAALPFLFADNGDALLFNEINSAYVTGFYPGVVEKTGELEKKYPDSAYLIDSKLLDARSLIKMNRYEEAVKVLGPVRNNLKKDFNRYVEATFLLGQAYYLNQQYESALPELYAVCKAGKNGEYYGAAVLYAGNTYFETEAYNEALLPYEYVIENGKNYSREDYDQTLQNLLLVYCKTGNYKKGVQLYSKLKAQDYEDQVYKKLTLYGAECYENTGKEEKAYSLYCQVVKSGYKNLAVSAMKKAYLLSSSGKVKENSAEVFSQAEETFEDSPDLVCDFWVRLGIDEFNNKNYETARNYLANAQKLIGGGVLYPSEILALYDAKLCIESEKNYSKADSKLEELKSEINASRVKGIKDSYYSTLIQCKALESKWKEIPALYQKIQKPDVNVTYNYAASLYAQGEPAACLEFLADALGDGSVKKQITRENLCLFELYAAVNTREGIYSEAVETYSRIDKSGLLSEKSRIEYAKVLFACYNYSKTYEILKDTEYSQKDYIQGLCKINQKDWQTARNHFIGYIKQNSQSEAFNPLAYFYKAYAEYKLNNTRDAYATFIRYTTEAPYSQNPYVCKAYGYAAKCALQTGDYKTAAKHAEQQVKLCVNQEEKQAAILFCADIYSGNEDYEKAIKVLEPYSDGHEAFAVKCLFQIAKNYEKLNQIQNSEAAYTKIFTEFPDTAEAEEAMYSLGGIYYRSGNYASAENRYNNYIYKYVDGKFADAAFYFCADSNLRTGAVEKSIMMNKNLIKKYGDSIYVYGACKNLLNAYYQTEDYSKALETARLMVKNYPQQASTDGIGRKVLELEQIVGGTDRKLAEKYSEYEKLGGSDTRAGRDCGTELVVIYASEENGEEEAVKLAEELVLKQTASEENYNSARNLDFLASYYRKNMENKKAADLYLKAAEKYRGSAQAEEAEAAAALYGAIEAFKAEGMNSDAKDTADLLIKLYPDSEYAGRGKSLVR